MQFLDWIKLYLQIISPNYNSKEPKIDSNILLQNGGKFKLNFLHTLHNTLAHANRKYNVIVYTYLIDVMWRMWPTSTDILA